MSSSPSDPGAKGPGQGADPRRRALLFGALSAVGLAAAASRPARAAGRSSSSVDDEADLVAEAMAEVVAEALNAWLAGASYSGGEIHGVVLYGGKLASDVDVAGWIDDGLREVGVSEEAAATIADTVAAAWTDWADGWTLASASAFPEFAAVAGAEAPTSVADPVPLKPETSKGFRKLKAPILEKNLKAELGDIVKDPDKGVIIGKLAFMVGAQVEGWSAEAMVEGIIGEGPVPTYAPPYVPVGPVIMGKVIPGPVKITEIPTKVS